MPSELEEYLMDYPGVSQVHVVPVSDEALGQRICVCLAESNKDVTLEDIRCFLSDKKIASFKMPDQLLYVDAWPRTAVNKIDKVKLQQMAERNVD